MLHHGEIFINISPYFFILAALSSLQSILCVNNRLSNAMEYTSKMLDLDYFHDSSRTSSYDKENICEALEWMKFSSNQVTVADKFSKFLNEVICSRKLIHVVVTHSQMFRMSRMSRL